MARNGSSKLVVDVGHMGSGYPKKLPGVTQVILTKTFSYPPSKPLTWVSRKIVVPNFIPPNLTRKGEPGCIPPAGRLVDVDELVPVDAASAADFRGGCRLTRAGNRPVGCNDYGMVAWLMSLKTPECPQVRKVLPKGVRTHTHTHTPRVPPSHPPLSSPSYAFLLGLLWGHAKHLTGTVGTVVACLPCRASDVNVV